MHMLRRWSTEQRQNRSDDSPTPDDDAGQTSDRQQMKQRRQATVLHQVGQRTPKALGAVDRSPVISTPKRSDRQSANNAADRRPAPPATRIRVSPPKRPPLPVAAVGKSESTSDNDYKKELFASGYMQTQWVGTAFDDDSTSATTQFVNRRRRRHKLHNNATSKPKTTKAATVTVDKVHTTTTTLSGDREPYAANFDRTQDELDGDNGANAAAMMRCKVCRIALRLVVISLSAAAAACAFTQYNAYGSLCAGANATAVLLASVALLIMETLCTMLRRRSISVATVRRVSLPIDSCSAMLLLTTAVLCATMPQMRQSRSTGQTICIVALSASAVGAVAAALLVALGSMRCV